NSSLVTRRLGCCVRNNRTSKALAVRGTDEPARESVRFPGSNVNGPKRYSEFFIRSSARPVDLLQERRIAWVAVQTLQQGINAGADHIVRTDGQSPIQPLERLIGPVREGIHRGDHVLGASMALRNQ